MAKTVVHPITAETHLPGEPISEPAVLIWIGDAILKRARARGLATTLAVDLAAARASGLTYDHQDGDPA